MIKKRLVIDWICNIASCDECGYEISTMDNFYITNWGVKEHCPKCGRITNHTIVAHEVSLLEEIKDID